MSRLTQGWLLVGLACVCAACASVPVRLYTLTPPEMAVPTPAASSTIALDVRASAPPELNRSNLMVRASQTQMTLLENERWSSPLSEEVKTALRLQLENRWLQKMDSSSSYAHSKLSVTVDVQRLESKFGDYALFEAAWSAKLSDLAGVSKELDVDHCLFRKRISIRDGYTQMVDGYQLKVAALADAIVSSVTGVTDIAGGAKGGAASCGG